MDITSNTVTVTRRLHTLVLDDEQLRSLASALLHTRVVNGGDKTLPDDLWEPVLNAIEANDLRYDGNDLCFHDVRAPQN